MAPRSTWIALLSVVLVVMGLSVDANAQSPWRVDKAATAGPLAQTGLSPANGRTRTVFVSFEYARKCDPVFSIIEWTGARLGTPIRRELLRNSKIGLYFNGQFHTSHAGLITYDNGYEAGFSISNDLLLGLLINLNSMSFVTPTGERIPLPLTGFRDALHTAMDICRSRAL
jgi:hypothetical protein